MSVSYDYIISEANPLDSVEELMESQNWVFNRMSDEELMVKVIGKSCSYNLYFIWQDEMNALQFCAQYDFEINESEMDKAARTLMTINENLWMGHFEIPKGTKTPSFRYTGLYNGLKQCGDDSTSHISDLVEVALAQCEKHYAVFYFLSHANDANEQSLSLAMMETMGES